MTPRMVNVPSASSQSFSVSGHRSDSPIFRSGFSDSVFSVGKGVSSVDASFSTIDIEEVFSNARQGHFSSFSGLCCQNFLAL